MRKRSTPTAAAGARKQIGASVQETWSTWATVGATAWTRQMRHLWCDCVVRLQGETNNNGSDDDDDPSRTITAHRVILARWPYFAHLFALTDPDRSRDREGDNGHLHHRHVYKVSVPFETSSVHALVDMLYDPRRLSSAIYDGECDAADLVGCALFLGAERDLLLHVIESALDILLPAEIDAEAATAPNKAVGAFLLRALDSGLDDAIKCGLVARLAYLLSDGDRDTLTDTFGRYYDPTQCLLLGPVAPGAVRLCCGLRDPRRKVSFTTPEWGEVTATARQKPTPEDPTTVQVIVEIASDVLRWTTVSREFGLFDGAAATDPVAPSTVGDPQPASGSLRARSPLTVWQIDLRPEATQGAISVTTDT
ncbi:BTB domain containing protein [Pandoravirus japonicus]|uniref:BTB domain containing protein n=1 Tax=Pandoravirus japonicus TaxID=2823154 RepID=A0A811BPG9_9VIRU|nr:BTB domain containing protein [Pandoravirus japonicus]